MRTRESTEIYCRRVNRVIDHIKDHLTEPLPIVELARLAHFSPFHFHRIFRSIVGEPLPRSFGGCGWRRPSSRCCTGRKPR